MSDLDKTCRCGHTGHDHEAGECWAESDIPMDLNQCPCNWWEPICADLNPWDSEIVCALPKDHDGLHRDPPAGQAWADHCHHPADDCQPCTNPRRSG